MEYVNACPAGLVSLQFRAWSKRGRRHIHLAQSFWDSIVSKFVYDAEAGLRMALLEVLMDTILSNTEIEGADKPDIIEI